MPRCDRCKQPVEPRLNEHTGSTDWSHRNSGFWTCRDRRGSATVNGSERCQPAWVPSAPPTVALGETITLTLPNGSTVQGRIGSTFDFIADTEPDHHFQD